MAATQALNTRSKKDPSYHLIVSFPAGEQPTGEQLEDIEETICASLGFAEHQRVSAAHYDTENVHLHLAINKIHPKSLNALDPFNDFLSLDQSCRELELKHGLVQDNRIDKSRPAASKYDGRIRDFEAHSGFFSFRQWAESAPVTSELTNIYNNAGSWQEVHSGLAELDVEIRRRGAGLALASLQSNVCIKASALGSGEWSLAKMEDKFGQFEAAALKRAEQKQQKVGYKLLPSYGGDSDLWQRYQVERELRQDSKRLLFVQKQSGLNDIRTQTGSRWRQIQEDKVMDFRQKSRLYDQLKLQQIKEKTQINALYQLQCALLGATTWPQFLTDQAGEGQQDALRVLRQRDNKPDKVTSNNLIVGEANDTVCPDYNPAVRKNGDVVYEFPGVKVQDAGDQLRIQGDDQTGVSNALLIAREKWGEKIKLSGSDEFKELAVRCAVEGNVAVQFADATLESRRQSLAQQPGPVQEHATGPVTAWIEERNTTGARVSDFQRHELFAGVAGGQGRYAGCRQIDADTRVALVESIDRSRTLVIPISEYQQRRWSANRVGDQVNYNRRGQLLARTGPEVSR